MEFSNLVTLIISIITFSNILLAGVVVFIERRDIGSTWAWLMIIYFIPVLGFIIYLFFGRQLKQKNFYNLSVDERDYLKSVVNEQLEDLRDKKFSNSYLVNKYNDLVSMNLESNALLTMDNKIDIFHDGTEKFESLFNDIRAAKKEINIQYYIIHRDSLVKHPSAR